MNQKWLNNIMILEIEDMYCEIEDDIYRVFMSDDMPDRSVESKLNSIIANTILREVQLTRIEDAFNEHIQRQQILERDIATTLKGLFNLNGDKQRQRN